MGQVIRIYQNDYFSLEEAQAVLPILNRITEKSLSEFLLLEEKLKRTQKDSPQHDQAEQQISEILDHWSQKVIGLGAIPKGIWLVDFDYGKGYYCWRYGDENHLYTHGYHDSFAGRVAVC